MELGAQSVTTTLTAVQLLSSAECSGTQGKYVGIHDNYLTQREVFGHVSNKIEFLGDSKTRKYQPRQFQLVKHPLYLDIMLKTAQA